MSAAESSYRLLMAGASSAAAIVLLPLALTIFPSQIQEALHRFDPFIAFCSGVLDALELDLPPLGLAVLTMLAAGIATAAVRTSRLLQRTRRLCAPDRVADPPRRLLAIAERAGVSEALHYVRDPRLLAYCVGVRDPRVVISDGALRRLRDDELEAVLLHEAEHLRRRDPLRVLFARTLAALFVGLPLIEWLTLRFETAKELDADRAALRVLGDPAPLAGALLALGTPADGAPLAIGAWSLTAARIDQISGIGPDRLLPEPPRRTVAVTALSVVLALVLALGQGVRAHALPAPIVASGHAPTGASCPIPRPGVLL